MTVSSLILTIPEDFDPIAAGAEIRQVRKARGLTLKDLSGRVDRSVAYLSRIERGEVRVSAKLLAGIGAALDVDPAWFFPERQGAGPRERAHVVRSEARRPLSNLYTRSVDELGFEDELISSSLAGGHYMMLSHFPAGAEHPTSPAEGYAYEGEQHGYVIRGLVELTLDGEIIILEAGDGFSYPTELPHRFRNASKKDALVVMTMAPVRITW